MTSEVAESNPCGIEWFCQDRKERSNHTSFQRENTLELKIIEATDTASRCANHGVNKKHRISCQETKVRITTLCIAKSKPHLLKSSGFHATDFSVEWENTFTKEWKWQSDRERNPGPFLPQHTNLVKIHRQTLWEIQKLTEKLLHPGEHQTKLTGAGREIQGTLSQEPLCPAKEEML